jgi:predicted DNA-binding protein
MSKSTATSFRLSNEARRILARLSKESGVSQAAVLELAIRAEDARRRKSR